jgi:hypothetical protein
MLWERLREFTGDRILEDDASLLAFEYQGVGE